MPSCFVIEANAVNYTAYLTDLFPTAEALPYHDVISLKIDKFVAIGEMEEFCEKYDVVSFFALSRYATKYRSDWSRVLKESASVYMREYLKSRQWSKENDCMHIIDKETGEMLV